MASLSSCHMLWFLSLARQRRYIVDYYKNAAIGVMAKNRDGKIAMTRVTLYPEVIFSDVRRPDHAQLMRLHEAAHEQCFIANSVRTEVLCEPVVATNWE